MSDQITTDVAVREQAQQEVASQFDGASENITTFLADLQVAYQIATRLVSTSFVPESYANKPQEAAAAIVTGQGVGLGPMESLRSIDIIQGTPAIRAIALRALVVSKGHEMWVEESTPARAVVAGRRAGSDKIQRSAWDMDRARTMGLDTKSNWRKQPGAMLVARATSECARLVAPDALLGIPYSSEELQDLDGPTEAAPKRSRGIRTLAARARAVEAENAPQTVENVEDAPEVLNVDAEPGDGGTAPDVTLFTCSRCGLPQAEDDGGICGPCEVEIEDEIAAEVEGES